MIIIELLHWCCCMLYAVQLWCWPAWLIAWWCHSTVQGLHTIALWYWLPLFVQCPRLFCSLQEKLLSLCGRCCYFGKIGYFFLLKNNQFCKIDYFSQIAYLIGNLCKIPYFLVNRRRYYFYIGWVIIFAQYAILHCTNKRFCKNRLFHTDSLFNRQSVQKTFSLPPIQIQSCMTLFPSATPTVPQLSQDCDCTAHNKIGLKIQIKLCKQSDSIFLNLPECLPFACQSKSNSFRLNCHSKQKLTKKGLIP